MVKPNEPIKFRVTNEIKLLKYENKILSPSFQYNPIGVQNLRERKREQEREREKERERGHWIIH